MLNTNYVLHTGVDKRQDRQQKQCYGSDSWVDVFSEGCFNLGVLRLAAVGGAVYNWSGLDAHIFPSNKQHNFSFHDVFVFVLEHTK